MGNAANALLQVEAAQSPVAVTELTADADRKMYYSDDDLWSKFPGKEPEIFVNGVVSGGKVTPAVSGSNNLVDVAALMVNLNGVLTSVDADTDVEITRAVSTDTHMINSITVNASGAIAVVTGTDGTAFSNTRGAAGGPPLIPVDSVEIAQVKTTSYTAAAIVAAEIYQVDGVSREIASVPYTIQYDKGADYDGAGVLLVAAQPAIHTGPVPRKVFASWNTPEFLDLAKVYDLTPPANSASSSSTSYFSGAESELTISLDSGSFSIFLEDGITDSIMAVVGSEVWFKFFPNKLRTTIYKLFHGYLALPVSYPGSGSINGSATIVPSVQPRDVTS